jgi:hypothetical protein
MITVNNAAERCINRGGNASGVCKKNTSHNTYSK